MTDDEAALKYGAEQFKLDWDTLVEVITSDPWARDNCLLAISAHSNDGVSGLKNDGSFEAVREELKAQPHIIFSANSGDREFFLGNKPGFGRDFIETTYGSLKPCLHGSDAHKVADVLKPADDRFCWIRADLSFTGLKQTLIEPELRVTIGSLPPPGPSESECIRELEVSGSPWLETGTISRFRATCVQRRDRDASIRYVICGAEVGANHKARGSYLLAGDVATVTLGRRSASHRSSSRRNPACRDFSPSPP